MLIRITHDIMTNVMRPRSYSRGLHNRKTYANANAAFTFTLPFTMQHVCIARTMPWQDVCASVCLSVCPSHAGIV